MQNEVQDLLQTEVASAAVEGSATRESDPTEDATLRMIQPPLLTARESAPNPPNVPMQAQFATHVPQVEAEPVLAGLGDASVIEVARPAPAPANEPSPLSLPSKSVPVTPPLGASSSLLTPRSALHIPNFEQYCRTHWQDAGGQVVPAPWLRAETRNEFIQTALDRMVESLKGDDWARARLFWSGLHQLAPSEVPCTDDFDHAISLRAGRWPPVEEEQLEMLTKLRDKWERSDIRDSLSDRLRIALVLAAPSAVKMLEGYEVEQFAELAGFSDRFRMFVVDWGKTARVLPDPLSALAGQLRSGLGPTLEELQRRQDYLRTQLERRLRDLHLAAGNRVKTTHCRNAWNEFMTEARPCLVAAMASPGDPARRTEVGRLKKRALRIFDRNEAKYGDRGAMDRAVDALIEAADEFFQASDAVRVASGANVLRINFPPSVTRLANGEGRDAIKDDEVWLLALFMSQAAKPKVQPSSVLATSIVEAYPWILSSWPLGAEAIREADVLQCSDPLGAICHLLYTMPAKPAETGLRGWVFDNAPGLLVHFAGLNERERGVVEDVQRRERDVLDTIFGRLRRAHVDLAELADQDVAAVALEIKTLENIAENTRNNPALVCAWGAFLLREVEEHVKGTVPFMS